MAYSSSLLLVPAIATSFFSLFLFAGWVTAEPIMSDIRVVFQTKYGDIEFGFYPKVAPKTVEHILKLVQLGAYNSNHFFRVDRGFVAQVADVVGGREAPLNAEQMEEGIKTVPGEFSSVKHTKGILSMGRYEDPDSASSSFSILLGNAPHLDGKYAIFGKVTRGFETLAKMEESPTRQEGIFVMPLETLTWDHIIYIIRKAGGSLSFSTDSLLTHSFNIKSSYYDFQTGLPDTQCLDEIAILRQRLIQSAQTIEKERSRCLP